MTEQLVAKSRERIAACGCEDGCPSCIHSPKCGAGNKPLDKAAALMVAEGLLGLTTSPESQFVQPAQRCGLGISEMTEPICSLPWEELYRVAVLDIETQLSAEEVGGWHKCDLMRLSVAVIADLAQQRYEAFFEDQAEELCQRLQEVDLVVGFNLKRFDYRVLQPYTGVDLAALPTLDILEEINLLLGHRLSLNHLAEKTLNAAKSGDGLLALQLFKEGRLEELTDYCRRDVELTARLFEFGLHRGHLIYKHRQGALVQVPVEWTAARLFNLKSEE
jgi:DEAD/DEAH box helicase domain-containing protein